MNTTLRETVDINNVLAILNNNVIEEENKKEAIQAMGISSCQVACMSYKCCTAHGRGGKHIQHSFKIK